jgi:hypothetical protein
MRLSETMVGSRCRDIGTAATQNDSMETGAGEITAVAEEIPGPEPGTQGVSRSKAIATDTETPP